MDLHYAGWVIEDGQPDRDPGEIIRWFATAFWTAETLSTINQRSKSV